MPQMVRAHDTQSGILDGKFRSDFFRMQPLRVWAYQVPSDLNHTRAGIPDADTTSVGKSDAMGF